MALFVLWARSPQGVGTPFYGLYEELHPKGVPFLCEMVYRVRERTSRQSLTCSKFCRVPPPPGARRHFLPCLYICILVASLLVSSPGSSGGGPGENVSRLHGDKYFDPWNMTCEGCSANLVIYLVYLTSIRMTLQGSRQMSRTV